MMSFADEIRQFLQEHGIRLNTDIGQHFLVDPVVLDDILDVADIQPSDHILEIGPGIGILTVELLARAKKVTAIELDQRLIPLLNAYVQSHESLVERRDALSIIQGNALQTSFPKDPYSIVANIPYHITSPLLRHAFLESHAPKSMTLMIQKEVAEKIVDTKHHGMLSILVGLFGIPHLAFTVPARAFLPPPKVDSAVLHIASFDKPKADPKILERVFQLTKLAFSQKRKMLRNSLGSTPEGEAMLKKAGIDLTRRPETLTVDEWIALGSMKE